MPLIPALYERLTGRPWTTTVSATEQFGPPPGAVYRDQLAGYTDYQLACMDRDELLARLRADGARQSRPMIQAGQR